ncbi:MAG: SRPBCC family protein [Pseudomonadota bacterium]
MLFGRCWNCAAHADALHLKPVRVERWANLVFANLDPAAPPLVDHLASMQDAASRCALERMHHVTTRRYPVSANWKVYVDNHLEGYHVPAVHPGLHRELDFRACVTALGEHHSCQYAPIAPGRGGRRVYDARAGAGETLVHFDWFALEPPADDAGRARLERPPAWAPARQDGRLRPSRNPRRVPCPTSTISRPGPSTVRRARSPTTTARPCWS